MNYDIDYSVIIRTLGTAGTKYERLLASIDNLCPKPKEVIVVLPVGYDKPKEQLGWETFYFSPKGMVAQRTFGMKMAKTRYALICDDDVCFDTDFVEKLHKPIEENKCEISAGPLLSFLPQKGLKTFISTLMGAASPTIFHKDRYVSIFRSTGYSFNRKINCDTENYYYSQSLAGTCFYADLEAMKKVAFEEEMWIDANGYSACEDQVMFYKAYLKGLRTIVVSNALYEHLDGKTSTRNNKPTVIYSSIFNRTVFWYRFIYTQQKNGLLKIWSRICFGYRSLWIRLWNWVNLLRGRAKREDLTLSKKALKDARNFIKTDSYTQLPKL